MPQQKRPLADAGANAPATKKVAMSSAAGKENEVIDYSKKTNAELSNLLKDRSLPYSGPKRTLVERLVDNDAENGVSSSGGGQVTGSARFEFVTICRPGWDIIHEKKAENDHYDIDDDEETSKQIEACDDGQSCLCGKPASEKPEWRWIITTKGLEQVSNLMTEVWKRDQDAQGEYHYNDFSGYGYQEVMENELAAMYKLFKVKDIVGLWAHIEAWALFVPHSNDAWWMSDDSQGVQRTLKLMGGAIFGTLDLMQKQELFKPDSAVKNIALVLGQLQRLDSDWLGGAGEAELAWCNAAVRKALKAGITFEAAPHGIEEALKEAGVDLTDVDEGSDEDEIDFDDFDWNKEFAAFKKAHAKGGKLGGSYYSLVEEAKSSKKGGNGGRGFRPVFITLGPGEDIIDFM